MSSMIEKAQELFTGKDLNFKFFFDEGPKCYEVYRTYKFHSIDNIIGVLLRVNYDNNVSLTVSVKGKYLCITAFGIGIENKYSNLYKTVDEFFDDEHVVFCMNPIETLWIDIPFPEDEYKMIEKMADRIGLKQSTILKNISSSISMPPDKTEWRILCPH